MSVVSLLTVVVDILDDEMVTLELESAAHTLSTAAVEVGFLVWLASRIRCQGLLMVRGM